MTCPVEDAARRARRLSLIAALRLALQRLDAADAEQWEAHQRVREHRAQLRRELEELEREEQAT